MLFRQIVFHSLLLGALSGLVLTMVQFWQVIPIIQTAELYEGGTVSGGVHDHSSHEHGAEEWAPQDGLERTGYTLLSNVLTAIGLAVVLLAAMVSTLKEDTKIRLDWRYGLFWGAAGYAVFYLSPAIGIPPEIPGATGADLQARQLWWLLTVLCTAGGLAGMAFVKSPWRWTALGIVVVPHLIGAPHPPGSMFPGQPPAVAMELEQLAREFFIATAITNATLWLVLGLASFWSVKRIVSSMRAGASSQMESSSV